MLTSEQFHIKHHKVRGRVPKFDTCRRCERAEIECRNKLTFRDRKTAYKHALGVNIERNWWPDACLYPYRCRYCEIYHLTTGVRPATLRRIDKMFRQWQRKTGQKVSERGDFRGSNDDQEDYWAV